MSKKRTEKLHLATVTRSFLETPTSVCNEEFSTWQGLLVVYMLEEWDSSWTKKKNYFFLVNSPKRFRKEGLCQSCLTLFLLENGHLGSLLFNRSHVSRMKKRCQYNPGHRFCSLEHK